MEQSPSCKTNTSSASQTFPAFYGTRRFITAFTRTRQLSLSSARSVQSMPPDPTSWRFILILSYLLRLGLSSGLFISCYISGILASWPAHLILLDLITRLLFGEAKDKAVPLQAWSAPEGSRKLRFPDFMTTAQDGGKVVSLTHRPPLPPGNTPGTYFC